MTLHEIGIKHGTDKATYHNYCEFYSRKLVDLHTGSGVMLELGVYKGASLKMWREWLPNIRVYGFDIDTKQCDITEGIAEVDCGDEMKLIQAVDVVLKMEKETKFRCIIDDASHLWSHQKAAFRALWRYTDIYIIEDIHTSVLPNYSGGAKVPPFTKPESFDLDFGDGVSVGIHIFQGKENDSWTAIFRRV
jgi:hypothetical protein